MGVITYPLWDWSLVINKASNIPYIKNNYEINEWKNLNKKMKKMINKEWLELQWNIHLNGNRNICRKTILYNFAT